MNESVRMPAVSKRASSVLFVALLVSVAMNAVLLVERAQIERELQLFWKSDRAAMRLGGLFVEAMNQRVTDLGSLDGLTVQDLEALGVEPDTPWGIPWSVMDRDPDDGRVTILYPIGSRPADDTNGWARYVVVRLLSSSFASDNRIESVNVSNSSQNVVMVTYRSAAKNPRKPRVGHAA